MKPKENVALTGFEPFTLVFKHQSHGLRYSACLRDLPEIVLSPAVD